ncbi:hypothetical protein ACFQJ7_15770 [Halovenus rubra]|uniref:Uncharacterized protein n=2 Tax=Halovenus rubra TaxID=869890 RepID=A0ABD5X8J8_9EURY|nr:hypothetical protein [Halovenus rubra]
MLLGGLSALGDEPGTALGGLLLGAGLLALGVKILQDAETTEKQKIKFITGDEAHQQIEVTLGSGVDDSVGAELSRILREQRS